MFGQRGATTESYRVPALSLNNLKPSLILIDLGTNDLVAGLEPLIVAEKIFSLARHLENSYKAVVGVCSVLYRADHLVQSVQTFEQNVHVINSHLRLMASKEDKIFFHMHKGFWETEEQGKKLKMSVQVWSHDLVHPNNQIGRAKYKNSIRNAISAALHYLKN